MRRTMKELVNIAKVLDIRTKIAILVASMMFIGMFTFVTAITVTELRAEIAENNSYEACYEIGVIPCETE